MGNPQLIGELLGASSKSAKPQTEPSSISSELDLSKLSDEQLEILYTLPDDQREGYIRRAMAEAKRREDKEREEEERRKANEAYRAKMEAYGKANEEYTPQWFEKMLAQRIIKKKVIKVTHCQDMIPQLLMIAYTRRVTADNRVYKDSEKAKELIYGTARWMITPNTKSGIILRGDPGVGKSTLMRAIMDVYAIMEKKNTMEVSAMDVVRADERTMKEMKGADMLAIDDMGVEPVAVKSWGNEVSPMVDLITERHKRLRFTIITTNLVEKQVDGKMTDEVCERYGQRVYERIRELCNEIKFGGEIKSYRLQK